MRAIYSFLTVLVVSVAIAPCLGQARPKPAAEPAVVGAATSAPVVIPDNVIKQIEAQFDQEPKSLKESVSIMRTVIEMCQQAQLKYPSAENMYKIQVPMLQAASWIARQTRDLAANEQMLDIARQISSGNAPIAQKFSADAILTIASFQPLAGPAISNDMIAKNIRAFIAKYEKTEVAPDAYMVGVRFASQSKLTDLEAEYLKVLEEKYPTNMRVKAMLRSMGKISYIGKPFEADLTKLDGTKLALPKDMLGKIVVIDFWATWCPTCRQELPHMKEVYAKYKDKGVEFIGVSLDKPDAKATLEKFVKDQKMDWVQTYSGILEDPTAAKYGIGPIPSVWVVGKDGKVFSSDAGEDLEATLDKALKGLPAAETGAAGKPVVGEPTPASIPARN